MTDNRSFTEIMGAHPGPWSQNVMPGIRGGMAEILVLDANRVKVELFTLLRVAMLVVEKHAQPRAA